MRGFSDKQVQSIASVLETVFDGDLGTTLVAIMYAAWRTWVRSILRFLPGCPTRTRRSVVWALIRAEAQTRLGNNPEIIFKETKQGHFFVQIPGRKEVASILIRFKFLDEDLLTSNYRTQTSIEYDRQMPLEG